MWPEHVFVTFTCINKTVEGVMNCCRLFLGQQWWSVCFQTLDSCGITLVLVQQLYLCNNSSQRARITRQRVILLWNCRSGIRGMGDVQKMCSICLIKINFLFCASGTRLRLFQFHVEVQCLVFSHCQGNFTSFLLSVSRSDWELAWPVVKT